MQEFLPSLSLTFGELTLCNFNSIFSVQLLFKKRLYLEALNQRGEKRDFLGGAVVKNLPANAGDTGLSPGLGRSHMAQSN